jgi:hypothetical protein
MSLIVDGTTGVTFNDSSLQGAAASPYVLKNRIINGDMRIDQRNAGVSVTITANPQYTVDRWFAGVTNASKISVQQSSTAPSGFTNSMLVTSLAATTPSASEVYYMQQSIEGYNVADLDFGLATAKTITISFWVRSSLTGSFGAVLLNAGSNRSFPFNYTISSANTWTQITQTITGDTTGTWLTTNSTGFQLRFGLGAGSTFQGVAGSWGTTNAVTTTTATNIVATNGATFYITGVQLEIGTSATPFERRMYGAELQLCQRYFYKTFSQSTAVANDTAYQGGIGVPGALAYTTGAIRNFTIFPQPMRTTPTVTYYNTNITTPRTNNVWIVYLAGGAGWTTATSTTNGEISDMYVEPNIDKSGSFTIAGSYLVSGFLTASAEL